MIRAEFNETGRIVGFYPDEIVYSSLPLHSIGITEEQHQDCLLNPGKWIIDINTKELVVTPFEEIKFIPPMDVNGLIGALITAKSYNRLADQSNNQRAISRLELIISSGDLSPERMERFTLFWKQAMEGLSDPFTANEIKEVRDALARYHAPIEIGNDGLLRPEKKDA